MSGSSAPATEHDLALARQFFEGNGSGLGMAPGFSMHPSELARLTEMSARPGMSETWVMEQQHQMRAYEEAAKASWSAEFGKVPHNTASSQAIQQQAMPGRPDCMFRFIIRHQK